MSENVGYIRVSSESQNTDRQLDGIILDRTFTDKLSGATKDRPQLQLCLQYLRRGDTLYVHSIDRLARSLRDLEDIVKSLTSRDVTVIFHTQGLTFTSEANPVSTMMLQMLGVIAQFERTLTNTRQREGIAVAKAKGKHMGRPTIDYNRRNEAIELCKQGMNISQISRAMGLSRSSINKLLQ